MISQRDRSGVTLRLVIGALCAIFFIPALMTFAWVFSLRETKAQAAAERAQAVAQRMHAEATRSQTSALEPSGAGNTIPVPIESNSTPASEINSRPWAAAGPLRRVYETEYRNESRTVARPIIDPDTGKTRMVYETVEVKVPVTTIRYVPVAQPTHGPKVTSLIAELRAMDEDDKNRKAKTDELKTLLLAEFQQQHQQQGEEIERTQQRLDALKKTHEQRESRKDEIVQRRVDQLTGRPDVLQWNPPENTYSQNVDAIPGPPAQPQPSSKIGGVAMPRPYPGQQLHGPTDRTTPREERSTRPTDAPSPSSRFVPRPPAEGGSSGANNEVFELARRLSADTLAESAARTEYEHMKRLHEKRAISDAELRQHAAELEQATRQAVLARLQWEAMRDRLKRDWQYAKLQVQQSLEQASEVHNRLKKSGGATTKEVLEADGSVETASKTFEDLQAKLEQLAAAEKLIGDSAEPAAVVESQDDSDVAFEEIELHEHEIEAALEPSPSTESDSDAGTSESLPPATR